MSWLIIVFTMFQCNCNVNLEDCLANEYNKCEYKASEIYVDCVKERTHCDLLGCDIEFRCDEDLNKNVANCMDEYVETFNTCQWFYTFTLKTEK